MCGLAKGDHEDRDDFYKRVERIEAGRGADSLKPTDIDLRLWRREVVSEALTEWEMRVQGQVAHALSRVQAGGSHRFEVCHPVADRLDQGKRNVSVVAIDVAAVRDEDYHYDEVVVTFATTSRWSGSDLEWQLVTRVLISIAPPEQGWDRFQGTYSNLAEPGALASRLRELEGMLDEGSLAESEPGQHAHHAHKRSLTERTVNGRAARALCGAFFVPRQDHENMPICPTCSQRAGELEGA